MIAMIRYTKLGPRGVRPKQPKPALFKAGLDGRPLNLEPVTGFEPAFGG
jgi:hypothetical protein